MKTNPKHLADAYLLAAMVDHYLVRVTPATRDEVETAQQILIMMDNAVNNENRCVSCALDMIEQDLRELEKQPS
jgi:hypothetical protein